MSKTSNALALVPRRDDANDPTLPVILEFKWPSTAIANAPIPRSARGTVWVVASMVAAFIAIAGFIPIDRVVTAQGIVVSRSPTIVVQPLDTAIVRSIEVHEGQQVKAGTVLAQLDPTFAAADLGALTAQVSSLSAEMARLQAESQDKPYVDTRHDADTELQSAIFAHRHAEFAFRVDNYASKIDELKSVIARSQGDADGYRQRLGVAQNIEDMRRELQAKEIGSKLNTLAAIDNRTEMSRALASAQQTAEGAKRDLAAMISERDGYVQGWRADVSQQLSDSGRKLSDAQEALNKATLKRDLVVLRADRDAIVQSVAKVSVGSVLQSGQQFLTLVPVDVPLEIEANISGREAGFVHIDDPVTIKFDTFPFSQYGVAQGTVRIISPDSFTAQSDMRNPTSALAVSPTSTEPYYRARIAIDRVDLHNVPEGFQPIPGMPVTADVKVGKRTVLTYLLGRLAPVAREGMREP